MHMVSASRDCSTRSVLPGVQRRADNRRQARYDDVVAALRDTRLSSNRTAMYVQAMPAEQLPSVQPLLDHVAKWIVLTDDSEHARLRGLVNQAFTPKAISALRAQIERLVED